MHEVIPMIGLAGLGLLVGAFGTLVGAGGGFILVPVLVLIYPDLKPDIITSISLAVVFVNATSGSIAYARMRRIDYKSALVFGLATLPGSIIGALTTGAIPRHLFNLILGIVLAFIGIFLFVRPTERPFTKGRTRGAAHRHLVDREGEHYDYSFNPRTGVILSFFVGFLSSLLGIGGGIIHVPVLTMLLNFPAHIATATSHCVLALMALSGTIVHLATGTLQQGLVTTLLIGGGVAAGAQLGAAFSHRVKPKGIIRALAVALLLVGVRLFISS